MSENAKITLAGTAREASENYKFDRLVKRLGKEGAENAIRPYLEQRGVSIDEFRVYRKVKGVIQNQGLDVDKVKKEVEQYAKETADGIFKAI